ncbi:hypothetical protein [Aliiroseovarius crassostreae]|uniref:hypothetical protein n=1 Tax=Aliiroseovarius crassostreae TaxID=154981 RepID=UPI0021FE634A|nr:hypothetical protein [Aliiroseovarius crassostreae]UWP99361.1 hypothetical protein K3X53_04220 [Aliiroseovarius crassostreae]
MESENKKQELQNLILSAYSSLSDPDFSFVEKALKNRPYNLLIEQLSNCFVIEELTDPNEDVCFRYLLKNADQNWVLELSMLGKFAVVLSILEGGEANLIDGKTDVLEEVTILSLLNNNEFALLGREELEEPIDLVLHYTEKKNTCIYHAMFSDLDIRPWESKNA